MKTIIPFVAASGTFGRSILHALLEANFTVTVLTRNSSAANFDLLGLHNIIETDYSPTSLAEVLQGQDALVSAVGVPGIPSQIVMINAAEHAGVKRFVLSEFGYAPEQARLPELLFMRASRDKVLDYVRSKTEVNSNLTWSAVATPIDCHDFMAYVRIRLAAGGVGAGSRRCAIVRERSTTINLGCTDPHEQSSSSNLLFPEHYWLFEPSVFLLE